MQQSIAKTPMLKAAGVDITKVKYVDAGWPTWGTALAQGKWESPRLPGNRTQPNALYRFCARGCLPETKYFSAWRFSKLPANCCNVFSSWSST